MSWYRVGRVVCILECSGIAKPPGPETLQRLVVKRNRELQKKLQCSANTAVYTLTSKCAKYRLTRSDSTRRCSKQIQSLGAFDSS